MSNKILNKQIQFPLSGSFTGSLFGTASYALFAVNGGGTGSNATASFNNQSVWTFNHNLGTLLVTIQTLDADYRQILPQSIQLINTASAVITFPVSKSGWAIASLGGAGSGGGGTTDISGLLTTASFNSYTGSTTSQFAGTSSFATTASYALNGGVTSIIAGSGISIDQATGNVTVNSTGGGGVFPFSGAAVITGSLVVSGSGVQVTGSLNVTNGVTGSLFGTASFATTASYALNAGAGSGFPFSGSAVITGSLLVSGSSGLTVLGPSTFKASGSNVNAISAQSSNFTAGSTGTILSISVPSGSTSATLQVRSGGGMSGGDLVVASGTLLIGSFSGSLVGTASTASFVTASAVVGTVLSSSYALTASFALNAGGGGGTSAKAGSGSAVSFTGTPRSSSISFGSAFTDNLYTVIVTGEDARSFTIQSKTSASFTINSNSSVALSGPVYWIATAFN